MRRQGQDQLGHLRVECGSGGLEQRRVREACQEEERQGQEARQERQGRQEHGAAVYGSVCVCMDLFLTIDKLLATAWVSNAFARLVGLRATRPLQNDTWISVVATMM